MAPNRIAPVLPALTLLAWPVMLMLASVGPVIDEWIHLRAIEHFASGKPGLPPGLAMFPGYHWLMSWPHRWFGEYLVALREVNAAVSLLAVWAYAAALRSAGRWNGRRLWRFVWLPILFPFLGLVYTEAASLATVIGALWLHVKRRFLAAAALLLIAVLIRQSNLVWLAMYFGWLAVDGGGGGIRRGWPYLAVLAVGGAALAIHGPLASVSPEVNAGVNPAQATVFGCCLLLLALPAFVSGWRRANGRRAWLLVPFWVVVTAGLAVTYDNPHAFNQGQDLWRNRLLYAMDASAWWRWFICAAAGGALVGLGRWIAEQLRRPQLLVWAAATLLYLAPHALVEPRYYILPLVFLGFLAELPEPVERRLVVWLAGLTALECAVLLAGGPLW